MFSPKSEEQLAWDLVKAAVRNQVNLETFAYRNRRINEILSEVWPAFQASLSGEEVLEIDPEYATWVTEALEAAREIEAIRV